MCYEDLCKDVNNVVNVGVTQREEKPYVFWCLFSAPEFIFCRQGLPHGSSMRENKKLRESSWNPHRSLERVQTLF